MTARIRAAFLAGAVSGKVVGAFRLETSFSLSGSTAGATGFRGVSLVFSVAFLRVARVLVARVRDTAELASAFFTADLAEARFLGARFGFSLASEVPSLMRLIL